MARKSCETHWVDVGASLGWVWFRGKYRRFVGVRPDGTVVGVAFRSRDAALLALAKDLRRRERSGVVLELDAYRLPGGAAAPRGGFGHGLAAFLARVSN